MGKMQQLNQAKSHQNELLCHWNSGNCELSNYLNLFTVEYIIMYLIMGLFKFLTFLQGVKEVIEGSLCTEKLYLLTFTLNSHDFAICCVRVPGLPPPTPTSSHGQVNSISLSFQP